MKGLENLCRISKNFSRLSHVLRDFDGCHNTSQNFQNFGDVPNHMRRVHHPSSHHMGEVPAQFSLVNADDFQVFHYLNDYTDIEEQNVHRSRSGSKCTVPNPGKRAKIKHDDDDSLTGYKTNIKGIKTNIKGKIR